MGKEKYNVVFAISNMTETTVGEARKLFLGYKDSRVFLNKSFDDECWFACDEYANYTLDYRINIADYQEFRKKTGMDREEFQKYLKTYCICQMGALAIGAIRGIIHTVKKVIACKTDCYEELYEGGSGQYIGRVSEFLSLLGKNDENEELMELLGILDDVEDTVRVSTNGGQRTLAAFESYFRFDEILKRFWAESDDEDEKLFFFPVWMWWNISAVIPLRPREFVLTPRQCITEADGKYYLTVRRSRLKGTGKTKSYKISKDYNTSRYQIPQSLAEEIRWYQEKTKDYPNTNINTLFVTDTHYSRWQRRSPYNSMYFTYINLRTCLRYFYDEIVIGRYGYSVIFERGNSVLSNEQEINYLQLGDTRHLALINLIAEGATPMVAMLLAGHDNPEMSSHYYSNISTLIECRTYRQYKQLTEGKQAYQLSTFEGRLHTGEFVLLEDNSRCYSAEIRKGSFSDCYKTVGPGGEVGLCQECRYHTDEGMSFRDAKQLYKNKIQQQCKNLEDIVRKIRSGRGEPEEIVQELLKLRDHNYSYKQYLLETMEG